MLAPPLLLVDGVPHPFVMRYNGYFATGIQQ